MSLRPNLKKKSRYRKLILNSIGMDLHSFAWINKFSCTLMLQGGKGRGWVRVLTSGEWVHQGGMCGRRGCSYRRLRFADLGVAFGKLQPYCLWHVRIEPNTLLWTFDRRQSGTIKSGALTWLQYLLYRYKIWQNSYGSSTDYDNSHRLKASTGRLS